MRNTNICIWVDSDFQRKCCRSLPNNSTLPPRHDQTKEGPHCNDRKSGRNGWIAQAFRLLCFKIRRHRIGRCTEERIVHERALWLHKYHHSVSIHHQHWHVQRMLVKGWQLSNIKGKPWQPNAYQIVCIIHYCSVVMGDLLACHENSICFRFDQAMLEFASNKIWKLPYLFR